MKKGAIFSEDKLHRYLLWRKWSKKPKILYMGLNPSKGDRNREDVTLHKLIHLTKFNGRGGFYIANLFSKVGANWENLKWSGDLIRKESRDWLRKAAVKVDGVCYMTGDKGTKTVDAQYRFKHVVKILNKTKLPAYIFRLGRHGTPIHPLMSSTKMKYVRVRINSKNLHITIL